MTLVLAGLLLCGARAAAAVTVEITGRPACAGFLQEVLASLGKAVPSAALPRQGLFPGRSCEVSGVVVRNLDLPALPAELLGFSDHPEKVGERGLLFTAGLIGFRPVRFQYYHLGNRPEGLYLALRLYNPGPEAARVHWLGAAAGPSADFFAVGQANNRRFLERLARFQGRVVTLAPGAEEVIASHPLPYGQVVSGTVQMTLLEGPAVEYSLFALADPAEMPSYRTLVDAEDGHARGIYPVADQRLVRSWVAGEGDRWITLGAVRQPNLVAGPALKGDYGVVYRVDLGLSNPASRPACLELRLNPRGGPATATLLVGPLGTFYQVGPRQAYTETPLRAWELAAGEKRRLEVWSIPEGASSYPVRLLLTEAPDPEGENR